MTVAEHLAASRFAHSRYRTIHDQTKNADNVNMLAAVQDAADQRQAAHDADPTHSDPAWQEDQQLLKVPHDGMMDFYGRYLAKISQRIETAQARLVDGTAKGLRVDLRATALPEDTR